MTIEREERSGVEILRMNRPKVNALDADLLRELLAALQHVESSGARALVLTGAGTAFSAGVDLFQLLQGGPASLRAFLPLLHSVLRTLFSFPKPTVAAVNGHAIAGGHLLMAACDRRLIAKGSGKVGVPEHRVGVPFPPLALEILRATLSPEVFVDLVYTGRTVGPEEALSLRVVHELAEPGEILTRAVDQAGRLATVPASSYGLTKREIVAPALERADRLQASLGDEIAAVWESAEAAEAIRSYLARTVGRGGSGS